MKIVNRKTFLSLPPGTVFAKYEPGCFCDELQIKGETLAAEDGGAVDYFYQDITAPVNCESSNDLADILRKATDEGESIPLDFDIQGRDAMFDDEQLFAVYEPKDVQQLIDRLRCALDEMTAR